MSVFVMKQDIQQAIANNIGEFKSNYKSLIFDKYCKDFILSFSFMKKFQVEVNNNELLYNVKLDENVLKSFTKEDIEKIKKIDLNIKTKNLIFQKNNMDNNFINIPFEDFEEEFSEEISAKDYQMGKISKAQEILKKEFNIETQLSVSKTYLSLAANLDKLYFNKNMLNKIQDISNMVDIFAILPYFEEDFDEIKGVRLFLAIDLI